MNIILDIKLSAYAKGIIPDVSNFISDAPADNNTYARKNKSWLNITDDLTRPIVSTNLGSGLNVVQTNHNYNISERKWEGNIINLPSQLVNDTIYYADDNSIEFYLDGGTAYSDSEETYGQIAYGGLSTTSNFNLILDITNSEGEIL